ncbi:MAG: ABC transporter ATP-binding protein [Myxococcaceae bacterium]|nr:ABC transporter ATP-binding protein [Myxococcaceae bacterium]
MTAAIVLKGVTKSFKKSAARRAEYTTFKSELLRWVRGEKRGDLTPGRIEALKGVDLEVPQGKTVGIVGRNGSGKSTLLKLITGIYAPTSGTVQVNGRISALLDLGAGFHPDFTGRENILINGIILGMSRADVRQRMSQIIEFAELGDFIDEPVRTYSSGMFMRLAFAVATHVDPEILIIDEILAVGDDHFQRKSQAKMYEFKAQKKTIVLVTHDLGTIERWCDHAVWIDGGVTRQVGAPAAVVAAYREAVHVAEAQNARTGDSALLAPGLALPALPGETTVAQAEGKIEVVEAWQQGAVADSYRPGASLEVRVTTELKAAKAWVLELELCRPDGSAWFTARCPLPAERTGHVLATWSAKELPWLFDALKLKFKLLDGDAVVATASHTLPIVGGNSGVKEHVKQSWHVDGAGAVVRREAVA